MCIQPIKKYNFEVFFFPLILSDYFNETNKLTNTTKSFHLKAIKTEMLKTLEEWFFSHANEKHISEINLAALNNPCNIYICINITESNIDMWTSNIIDANEINCAKIRVKWIKNETPNLLIMQYLKAINKSRPMETSVRWQYTVHMG